MIHIINLTENRANQGRPNESKLNISLFENLYFNTISWNHLVTPSLFLNVGSEHPLSDNEGTTCK
jgi:hypothetical protein